MTSRERFINTITGKKIDRLPFFFHFGPWPETIARWRDEGMTGKWIGGFYDGMGFDPGIRHVDVKLGYFPYGLLGTLRDVMGVEELCCAFYEDPELVREMMETFTDLWLAIYEKVCNDVKVDVIHMWEDMSGKNGSLIFPAMVREFMMPCYKRIAAFAKAHDIPVFSLDTDGDCSELVPLFMESGINMIFPFEVAAGSDVVDYRKKYPNLGIMGGINKIEIAKGRDAIDRELARLAPMFDKNPYIAMLDHLIPPEISWEDFNYFVERLRDIILNPPFSD